MLAHASRQSLPWLIFDVGRKKMEFFLRFTIMPVSLVASIVFCLLAWLSLRKWPQLSPACSVLAGVGCVAVAMCIAISVWPGATSMNQKWPLFYGLFYRFCFLIGPPAIATLLIVDAVKKKKGKTAALLLPIIACFFVCVVFLIGDIAVYEAAYGPS